MNKCEKCGFLHYRTDPCRGPTKSTAALKEVHDKRASVGSGGVRQSTGSFSGASRAAEPAGTQALPVDTKAAAAGLPASKDGAGSSPGSSEVRHLAADAKFDKKAWMREYMREHRRGMRRRVAK